MKYTVNRPVEIEIMFVQVSLPVRYEEEDITNDFPLRNGEMWNATIEIDTGRILEWPQGVKGELNMKVTDAGVYVLLDKDKQEIARREDYVPDIIPGRYGDYVELDINEEGIITNWSKKEGVREFFRECE